MGQAWLPGLAQRYTAAGRTPTVIPTYWPAAGGLVAGTGLAGVSGTNAKFW